MDERGAFAVGAPLLAVTRLPDGAELRGAVVLTAGGYGLEISRWSGGQPDPATAARRVPLPAATLPGAIAASREIMAVLPAALELRADHERQTAQAAQESQQTTQGRDMQGGERPRSRPTPPTQPTLTKAPAATTLTTITLRATDLPALRNAVERLEGGAETVELRARVVRRPEGTPPASKPAARQGTPSGPTSPQVRR